jgi:aminoglycoside phosphotransferase (APT) family kinase protein
MTAGKMHPDEVETDEPLVRRLLAAQFPRWADLPIRPVPSGGTDNAIYRLGDEMAVRLPRIHWAVEQVEKAPRLPLAIPVPLAMGRPGEGYPYPWSVYRWLDGENAAIERLSDAGQAASDLAAFILALQGVDATDGPPPGSHNAQRGVPLALRDAAVRDALARLYGEIDTDAATAAWEEALHAPPWSGPPVWIHGDLQSGNLLAVAGRIRAVIDFGCLGVGDPACELIVAWNLLPAEVRPRFRDLLGVDEATWTRGRGWALSVGLIALPYYLPTSPAMVRYARHTIAEVLADFQKSA